MMKCLVATGLLLYAMLHGLEAQEVRPAGELKGGSDEHVTFTGSIENSFQMLGTAASGWKILSAYMEINPFGCWTASYSESYAEATGVVEDYKSAPTLFIAKLKGEIVPDTPGEGPIPTYSITAHCSLYRTYPDIAKAALAENGGQWEITPATNFLALTVDDGVWTATASDWELTGPFNGPKVSGKERVAIGPPGGDFVVESGGIYSIIGTSLGNYAHFDQSILLVYKVFFPDNSETIADWNNADGYDVKAKLSADSYNKSHLVWQVTEGSDYFSINDKGVLKLKGDHPPLEQLAMIKVQAASADMPEAKDEFVLALDGAFKVDICMRNLDEDREEEPGALLPLPEEGKKSYEAFTMKIKPRQASGKATLAVSTILDIWEKTENGYVLVTKRTWDLSKEELPPRFYAEPVKAGIGWLELTYHPGDGRAFSDKVKVTVFKINLVIQNLPEETNPTPNEMDPGAKILFDNDDDNGNGIRDLEDKTVAGEDDLVAAKINFEPEDVADKLTDGTLTLKEMASGEVGTGRHLKIWKDKDKSEQFSSYRFGPDGSGGEIPDEVYVEGIRGGTTELKLSFGAAADYVKIGVHTVGLDLDVDSNNDGEIKEDDDSIEEQEPGFILPMGGDGPYLMKLHMPPIDETLDLHWPKPEIVTIKQSDDGGELKIYDDNNHEVTVETNLFSSLKQNHFQTFQLVGVKLGKVELTVQYGKDKIVIAEDKVVVRVVDVDMRTDLNRDGKIDFGDDGDRTSAAKPWRFWVNNDCDRAEKDVEEDVDPSSNRKDYLDDVIGCKRDLEDFSLLHLRLRGFTKEEITRCHLRFESQIGGNLFSSGFNLFHFPKGSPAYLTDEKVAARLVKDSKKLNVPVGEFSGLSEFELTPQMFNSNMEAVFIFEGKKAGKGAWNVKLVAGGSYYEKELVHVEMMDIKNMYEHYTVGDYVSNEDNSPLDIPLIATRVGDFEYTPQSPEEKDYVLFVHGWRMKTWERRAFAETTLKRIWWQGYKGRFGFFSWPTEWVDVDVWYGMGIVKDLLNYDRSEHKAYYSAYGLQKLIRDLNTKYPGKVRMFAHSMGNIIASEALRIEAESPNPRQTVHTFLAAHAASVADAYDNTAPDRSGLLTTIPDVYGHYPPFNADEHPEYFRSITNAVSERIVNFYHPSDKALSKKVWEMNQKLKPDPNYDYYLGSYVRIVPPGTLSFPEDRYEIFSYVAEAHSKALGAQSGVRNVIRADLNLQVQFGFTESRYDHSAEFLSDIVTRRAYWRELLRNFGFVIEE